MDKQSKIISTLTIFLSIAGIAFLVLWVTPNIGTITEFTRQHWILGSALLILWRVISIVIPPLPGGILSLALVPVFGWFWSFIYSTISVLTGASIAFFLARKFREPLVKKMVPLQILHKWEGKISHRTEFFVFVGIRFTTNAILDFISYIAGLSKISYKSFIIATIIGVLPDALFYYAVENIYGQFYKESPYLGIISLIGLIAIFYLLGKSKIFQKE